MYLLRYIQDGLENIRWCKDHGERSGIFDSKARDELWETAGILSISSKKIRLGGM